MGGFTEQNYNNLVDLLNMVARNAEFRLSLSDSTKLALLYKHVHSEILPKVESHIMEVKSVKEMKPKETK